MGGGGPSLVLECVARLQPFLDTTVVTKSLLDRRDVVEIRNTPCSQMAAILLILYSYVSSFLLRFLLQNSREISP